MSIGIDLVAVKKFKKIKKSDHSAWRHVFTDQEWGYAFGDSHSAEHLAGMFAAKEAAMKASGKVGVEHMKTFEVRHTVAGAPVIKKKGYQVSISHDQAYAVAVVCIT